MLPTLTARYVAVTSTLIVDFFDRYTTRNCRIFPITVWYFPAVILYFFDGNHLINFIVWKRLDFCIVMHIGILSRPFLAFGAVDGLRYRSQIITSVIRHDAIRPAWARFIGSYRTKTQICLRKTVNMTVTINLHYIAHDQP